MKNIFFMYTRSFFRCFKPYHNIVILFKILHDAKKPISTNNCFIQYYELILKGRELISTISFFKSWNIFSRQTHNPNILLPPWRSPMRGSPNGRPKKWPSVTNTKRFSRRRFLLVIHLRIVSHCVCNVIIHLSDKKGICHISWRTEKNSVDKQIRLCLRWRNPDMSESLCKLDSFYNKIMGLCHDIVSPEKVVVSFLLLNVVQFS